MFAVFRMSELRLASLLDFCRRRFDGRSTGRSSSSSSQSASASHAAGGGGKPEAVTRHQADANSRASSCSRSAFGSLLAALSSVSLLPLLPRLPLPPLAAVERLTPSGRTVSGSSRTALRPLSKPSKPTELAARMALSKFADESRVTTRATPAALETDRQTDRQPWRWEAELSQLAQPCFVCTQSTEEPPHSTAPNWARLKNCSPAHTPGTAPLCNTRNHQASLTG